MWVHSSRKSKKRQLWPTAFILFCRIDIHMYVYTNFLLKSKNYHFLPALLTQAEI